ncbi:methyltransferase domain-containing protein [Streptomyces sp. NPDC059524]|uniref:methyltransferase domain-containing protein n=1 Tax=Streptomyces sp. NPDC059524 TaxID=3346856 RepID=UPI003695C0B2
MGAEHADAEGGDSDGDLAVRAERARAALVREIELSGAFDADPRWRDAFAAVPRHLFVPYYIVGVPGGYERLWGQDPDPRRRLRWLEGAYADQPLATRMRDGELISSSSQPSLMATMLVELGVEDGDRVLEVGAGTGYNAALLAHRLGPDAVTTVDLDPEITESARAHLAAAGYRAVVVTGDGARGCPERAPFDRIIVTCALRGVPFVWLEQCRPGARILAPLSTGIVVLTVRDAGFAQGRFLSTSAYFVALRGAGGGEAGSGWAGRLPRSLVRDEVFRFVLTLVGEYGGVDAREVLRVWEREGRPGRERFGVTLDRGRAYAWLDDPAGPHVWPLRGSA